MNFSVYNNSIMKIGKYKQPVVALDIGLRGSSPSPPPVFAPECLRKRHIVSRSKLKG